MSERTGAAFTIQPLMAADILDYIKSNWRIAGASVLVWLVVGVIWILITPRTYEAVAVFAPVNTPNTGGASAAVRTLIGGTNPGLGLGEKTASFAKFQVLLTSTRVAAAVNAAHPEILQTAYKPFWDPNQKRWVKPTGTIANFKGHIKAALGLPPWQPPGPEELSLILRSNLKITLDDATGLLTIRYDSENPAFAAKILTWTCQAADDVLRRMARERTNARIEYLRNVIPNVLVAEQRQTLIDLLSQQEQSRMMIQADQTYVAEQLITPGVPRTPVWPKPGLILMVCAVIGAIFGIFICYVGQHFSPAKKIPAIIGKIPVLSGWLKRERREA